MNHKEPSSLKGSDLKSEVGHMTDDYIEDKSLFQPQIWCGQHLTGHGVSPAKHVYNYSQIDECRQRTPMCRIAELARYNKIKHEYKLMDESGPAHKKQFTVSLVLTPDQVYYGKGASIKKAQQSAAESALNGTTLPKPPDKVPLRKIKKEISAQNPITLLSYVAERLGIGVNFIDEIIPIYPVLPPHYRTPVPDIIRPLIRSSFVPVINEQFFAPLYGVPYSRPCTPAVPQQLSVVLQPPNTVLPPRLPFLRPQPLHKVRLILSKGFPEFIGKGITKKKARNSAASQALSHLAPYLAVLEAHSKKITSGLKDGIRINNLKSVVTTTRNGKPKSSISQIHECALHMRMNVEFLLLKEEGPAHDRRYVLRCKLISANQVIAADGEGSSKKIAKQNACSSMLSKLQSVESSPIFIAATMWKSQKKIPSAKELKRKTISKDMKMNPEYGHQINPISRLMQIMQARKQSEPKFQLLVERGQSRYKEFVMEVTCDNGLRCEGTGPNKKLAKRAAAEALLAKIGYVKPMPKPGKSLLKKRPENQAQVEIGLFKLDEEGKLLEGRSAGKEEKGLGSEEKISEVTLSVTASMDSQMMTFTDVDGIMHDDEQRKTWCTNVIGSKSISGCAQGENVRESSSATQQAAHSKRRVTFSNEVSACPPPEDSTYPSSWITPLKSEVVIASKLRKKGRDSKKWLTDNEKKNVAELARNFLTNWENTVHSTFKQKKAENDGCIPVNQMAHLSLNGNSLCNGYSASVTAKCHLQYIAEQFKFSVNYTDFPTSQNEMENQCFSLISIGIDKPIVCHGTGSTEESAHEDAARNALLFLCRI